MGKAIIILFFIAAAIMLLVIVYSRPLDDVPFSDPEALPPFGSSEFKQSDKDFGTRVTEHNLLYLKFCRDRMSALQETQYQSTNNARALFAVMQAIDYLEGTDDVSGVPVDPEILEPSKEK